MLKSKIEISSVGSFVTIGGIQQPVIGQRVVKHRPNALIDENLPVVILATREPGNPASEVRYVRHRRVAARAPPARAQDDAGPCGCRAAHSG